jgi:cysteine desulfurase
MKQADSIYLDHAAATFLLPVVQNHISKWLQDKTVNPSSLHSKGRQAGAIIDRARRDIAKVINCKASEIIFTSGGTEANNLALIGLASSLREKGQHIITCKTEHPSVLESCKQLKSEGFTFTYLETDSQGQIDLNHLKNAITDQTILITLMWVNNETGLIHPVESIAQIAQEYGVIFHCDAAQAFGHIPIRADLIPIDAISFSAHKIGAPSGTGALFLRKGTPLRKQNHGGGQESGQRAGTQNVLGASAFSLAAQYHDTHFKEHLQHYTKLLNHLHKSLLAIEEVQINRGDTDYSPHILNCSFHDIDGEALFIRLDMKNISVSNGAACSSGSQAPSHVLTAMGMKETLAQASLRISLGIDTTLKEIDHFCEKLSEITRSIRSEAH